MDTQTVQYRYDFKFGDDKSFSFIMHLSPNRMKLLKIEPEVTEKPDWALIEYFRCGSCSLDEKENPYCPVALNIAQVINQFRNTSSLEMVELTVTLPERTTICRTQIHYALGSLLGLCNSLSGCPILKEFAPIGRFHLPVASVDETVYRTLANYLLGQYCRHLDDEKPDWGLTGLKNFYTEVAEVNRSLCERFRTVSVEDANMNAVITLDTLVQNFIHLMSHNIERVRVLYQ